MVLSNQDKLAMCLALSTMSPQIDLTRYKIFRARNASVYNIKSGQLQYDINFSADADCDEVFRRLIRMVYREKIRGLAPTLEELQDDDVACEKFIDIINTFKLDANKNTVKYQYQQEAVSLLTNRLSNFVEFAEESNHINGEMAVLSKSLFMLDKLLVANITKEDKIKMEDLEAFIASSDAQDSYIADNFIMEFPWLESPVDNSQNEELNKEMRENNE